MWVVLEQPILSQSSGPSHTRHTASPSPHSDVTATWPLPASTNKIFGYQRFKHCLYPSRLNSFISYQRNNFLSLKLGIESCSSDNCTVQAQWCHEHTQLGLRTQHQLNHGFCLVPVTQWDTGRDTWGEVTPAWVAQLGWSPRRSTQSQGVTQHRQTLRCVTSGFLKCVPLPFCWHLNPTERPTLYPAESSWPLKRLIVICFSLIDLIPVIQTRSYHPFHKLGRCLEKNGVQKCKIIPHPFSFKRWDQ